MRVRQFILNVITVGFMLVSLINAQGLKDIPLGYNFPGPDAAMVSSSGIGTGGWLSDNSIFLNPALVPETRLSATFSISGFRLEERRSFPVYDRFEGIVTNGTYVVNNNMYNQIALTLHYKPIKNMNIAFFYRPFTSFEYDYTEQVRENIFGDFVIARNNIRGNGTVYLTGINGSYFVIDRLSVGINLGILSKPTVTYREESVWIDSTSAFYSIELFRKVNSISPFVQLGLHYTLSERWAMGMVVELPITIKMETRQITNNPFTMSPLPPDMQYDEEFSYPLIIRGGFEYRAQTPFRSRFLFDYSYAFWSATDVLQAGQKVMNLDDTYEVGAALELQFLHKNQFMISYKYHSMPWDKTQAQADIGLGIGIPVPHGKISAGIGFAKRSYNEYDLFPDSWFGGDRSFSPLDDVDENYMFGSVSFTYFLK